MSPNEVQFYTLRSAVTAKVVDGKTVYSKGNPVGMIAYSVCAPEQSRALTIIQYQLSSYNQRDPYDDKFARTLTAERLKQKPLQFSSYTPIEEEEVLPRIMAIILRNKREWMAKTKQAKLDKNNTRSKYYRGVSYPYYYGNISQRFVDAIKSFGKNADLNKARIQAIRDKVAAKKAAKLEVTEVLCPGYIHLSEIFEQAPRVLINDPAAAL